MNNATWIPEAGGYVYNGQVISQNPVYDSNGKQIVTATMEQIKSPSNASQTINANNVQNQTGATVSETATANKPNTNMQTAIGSLGTTNNNTATSGTAVSSPATNSPQTNAQAQDPVQKYITDYSTALANQDLSGQINALMELDKYTVSQGGVPQYSEVIGNLQKQNTEQVTNTVNEYALQIAEATKAGNTALANGLQQELASFKQENDYASVLENRKAEIETEYSFAYMQGINDITSGILSLLGQYNNFQYDPYSDPALQMAQGYAVSSVKEQMNSTGMYYSSMTQSAITRAINELVPVYQQMAKDEILQNINLLQSTASYLMNLEKAQFDMWSSQIELQILKNKERREEIAHAWDRVNNLGYVDNEASLILGVDVGTLSPEIRKAIMAEEAELRKMDYQYTIDKKLERFKKNMAIEKAQAEYNIATYGTAVVGENTDKTIAKKAGTITSVSTLTDNALASAEQGVSKYDIITEIRALAKTEDIALSAITQAKDINGEYIFDNKFIDDHGLDNYINLLAEEKGTQTPQEMLDNSVLAVNQIISNNKVLETATEDEKANAKELTNAMIQKYAEDSVCKIIDENALRYSDKITETQSALTDSVNAITTFSSALYENGSDFAKDITIANYEYLFDSIANASDNFDSHWLPNQGKWSKDIAISELIKKIEESNYYGNDTKEIVSELTKKQTELKSKKKIG